MIFSDYGFEERIQRGIDEAGFSVPTPVQNLCFKLLINEHRDIYAQSQTGTGKTAAFLLGIFQLLTAEERYKNDKALIIVPTRELAVQIEQEGLLLGKYLDMRILAVFGGVGYTEQERILAKGVDILVGTPGRLIDFHKKGNINFRDFGFMVIDEADRLFDMGFLPDLRKIFSWMKPKEERHTLLFSATLNARVGNLAWEFMNKPGEVIIEPEKVTVDTVTQELYHVGKGEKIQLLLGLLERENPENAVIFTNTQHVAWEVAKRMEVNGYSVSFLIGDLPQKKRLKIVNAVKKGHHKFLVATDVASRGLHIDELEMVINYDVPLEPEAYVHRVGRTARVGKEGKTITMACEEYVYGLAPIEKLLGKKIPVVWADEKLMLQDKSAGIRFSSGERLRELGKQGKESSGMNKKKEQKPPKPPKPQRRQQDNKDSSPREKSERSASGKASLDTKAIRAQSAVSMAAGSISDTNIERKDKTSRPRTQNKQRQQDKKEKIPNKANDRMEYYRWKYGDEFRPSDSNRKDSPQRKKKHKPRPPSASARKKTEKTEKTVPAARLPEPTVNTEIKPAEDKEKKGFFKRFFGNK